jgi:hypothetical protein
MTSSLKYLTLILAIIAGTQSFSQNISEKDVLNALSGSWELVYESQIDNDDTTFILSQIIINLKKKSGNEIGVLRKDGSQIKNRIKWKFVESKRGTAILFKGGIWVDEQDFDITEISDNKISMLSCSKHDNCTKVYLIRL